MAHGRVRISELALRLGIEPRDLFCAYHLGLAADGSYAFQNLHDVAARFGVTPGIVQHVLADLALDPDSVLRSGFPLAEAHADVMFAPSADARRALAYALYAQFLAASRGMQEAEAGAGTI